MPTFCVWLADVDDALSEKYLAEHFSRYGVVTATYIDRRFSRALVFFDGVEHAQRAVNDVKSRPLKDRQFQVRNTAVTLDDFYCQRSISRRCVPVHLSVCLSITFLYFGRAPSLDCTMQGGTLLYGEPMCRLQGETLQEVEGLSLIHI